LHSLEGSQFSTDRFSTDLLARGRTFFTVLAFYFLVNIGVRLVLPHALELDEGEQAYLSQWLLAGYGTQPPIYNWLQYLAVHLFGMSMPTLSGLKNLLLFGAYGFYFMAARQVLKDKRLAVVAVLGLLTIPQVSFEAQRDLSHTVAAIFGSSLFLFALFRLLSVPTLASFLLFGLATGIGGMTKYNFVLLPVCAMLAVLMDSRFRARVLDWRILLSVLVALVVVAPHAVWLLDNLDAASSRSVDKLISDDAGTFAAVFRGLRSLLLASIGFMAVTAVVFALSLREKISTVMRADDDWSRFAGRILAFVMVILLGMVLFGGVDDVRDRWLTPLLLILPLYLTLKIDASGIDISLPLKRLWVTAGAIMVIVPLILFGRVAIDPFTRNYGYVNIPFDRLAKQIEPELASDGSDARPVLIIASDGLLAGNMRFNLPNTTVVVANPPKGLVSPATSSFRKAVFVWRRSNGAMPAGFQSVFETYLKDQGLEGLSANPVILRFPYSWGHEGDEYQFAMATVDLPD
jgi:4-amino-4-deoxy-L-arabinose transferase-like glycosyltransferase